MFAVKVWTLTLLALGLALLVVFACSRAFRRKLLAGDGLATPWSPGSDGGLALGLFRIGGGVFGVLAYGARQQMGGTAGRATGLRKLVLGISPTVLAAVAVCVLARLRGRTPEQALGLASSESTRDAGRGVVAYLTAYPAVMAGIALWAHLFDMVGVEIPSQEAVKTVLTKQAWPEAAASVAVVVIMAPLLEEMVFRGFLLSALSRRMGPTGALVLTAALFGLLHTADHPFYAGPIFVLGLLLGWLYLRPGRLWVAVGCHGAHNALALLTAWLAFG